MATELEDLRLLQMAEGIADNVWRKVIQWAEFPRGVVGQQLARAVDSIGANIAEAYGRFHYGEKAQFLYYARGSLFETKYWLNRSLARNLLVKQEHEEYAAGLTALARQLNSFVANLKRQKRQPETGKMVKESAGDYFIAPIDDMPDLLFSEEEIAWLRETNGQAFPVSSH